MAPTAQPAHLAFQGCETPLRLAHLPCSAAWPGESKLLNAAVGPRTWRVLLTGAAQGEGPEIQLAVFLKSCAVQGGSDLTEKASALNCLGEIISIIHGNVGRKTESQDI